LIKQALCDASGKQGCKNFVLLASQGSFVDHHFLHTGANDLYLAALSIDTDPATVVRQAFAPLSAVPKAAFVGEEKGRRCRVCLATAGGAAA
jgi:hypothetical protein